MLTFLTGLRSPAGETLLVRITRIIDGVFHAAGTIDDEEARGRFVALTKRRLRAPRR